MGKIQKVYTKEFKEEAVRLAQTSGKPIAQIARGWGSPIRPFMAGARNWQSMGTMPFQAKGIKASLKKKTVASNANSKGLNRSVIY